MLTILYLKKDVEFYISVVVHTTRGGRGIYRDVSTNEDKYKYSATTSGSSFISMIHAGWTAPLLGCASQVVA
jgi:hypothetical protein